jgi:hypothetical protein
MELTVQSSRNSPFAAGSLQVLQGARHTCPPASRLAVGALLLATACSASSSSTSLLDGGTDAPVTSDGTTDAAPTDSNAPADSEATDAEATPGPRGTIIWQQFGSYPSLTEIVPNFYTGAVYGGPCRGVLMGNCCFDALLNCMEYADGATTCADAGGRADSGPAANPDASAFDGGACAIFDDNPNVGDLTFTDNGGSLANEVWTPLGYAYVVPEGGTIMLKWQAGDVLGASSPGGGCFSSFSGAVHAAAPIGAVVPAKGSTIADLVVTWTPAASASAAEMVVYLGPGPLTGAPTGQATCFGSDATGSLTIPAAIAGMVGPGASPVTVQRAVKTTTASTPPVVLKSTYEEDYDITLQ